MFPNPDSFLQDSKGGNTNSDKPNLFSKYIPENKISTVFTADQYRIFCLLRDRNAEKILSKYESQLKTFSSKNPADIPIKTRICLLYNIYETKKCVDESFIMDLLTLKKMYMYEKQRVFRERILGSVQESFMLDQFFSTKTCDVSVSSTLDDIRLLEEIESNYLEDKYKKERQFQIDFCKEVVDWYRNFVLRNRLRLSDKLEKIYRGVLSFHADLKRMENQRKELEIKEKIQFLKSTNEEEYQRFVKETRDNRLKCLFDRTNDFFKNVSYKTQEFKDSVDIKNDEKLQIKEKNEILSSNKHRETLDLNKSNEIFNKDNELLSYIQNEKISIENNEKLSKNKTEDDKKIVNNSKEANSVEICNDSIIKSNLDIKNKTAESKGEHGTFLKNKEESELCYNSNFLEIREKLFNLPSSLKVKLKEYQRKGVEWLYNLYLNGFNSILADETGLDKTIQIISFISCLVEFKSKKGPFLIVVPISNISNWSNDIKKYNPELTCLEYKGSSESRKLQQSIFRQSDINIVITTYEFFNKDKNFLSKIDWFYLVFEEVQRLKNKESKLENILSLDYKIMHRIILKNNSLINSLDELWFTLNFIVPNIFNSSVSFDEWFNGPLRITDEKIKVTDGEEQLIIGKIQGILKSFLLRRLKKEVASELPEKTERVIKVSMSLVQKIIYNEILTRNLRISQDKPNKISKNVHNSKENFVDISSKSFEISKSEENNIANNINENIIENLDNQEKPQQKIILDDNNIEDTRKGNNNGHFEKHVEGNKENLSKETEINGVDCIKKNLDEEKKNDLDRIKNQGDINEKAKNLKFSKEIMEFYESFTEKYFKKTEDKEEEENQNYYQKRPHSNKLTNKDVDLGNCILQLRKICNHPFLFEQIEKKINPLGINNMLLYTLSGKFEMLNRILPKLKATNRKILILFQLTQVITIMEDLLTMQGFTYLRIDGNKRNDEKTLFIDKFNSENNQFILLASIKSVESEINLISADTFIVFESYCNSEINLHIQENEKRNKNEVRIFRLITENSIEEFWMEKEIPKLDFDIKTIQTGKHTFANNLKKECNLIKEINNNDSTKMSNIEEINIILARSEQELNIFNELDRKISDIEKYDILDLENDYGVSEVLTSEINSKTGSHDEPMFKKPKSTSKEANVIKESIFNKMLEVKDGDRNRMEIFMNLPPKDLYPDYYKIIKNPISMNCIKRKLKNNNYRVNNLKKDFVLMFNNAMTYNVEDSSVYIDAMVLMKHVDGLFENIV